MKYIVQMLDPKALTTLHLVSHDGERGWGPIAPSRVEASNPRDHYTLLTYEFDNEKVALQFAEEAAQERPGWDVYVCEVKFVVTTDRPATIVKEVSKKGILPV